MLASILSKLRDSERQCLILRSTGVGFQKNDDYFATTGCQVLTDVTRLRKALGEIVLLPHPFFYVTAIVLLTTVIEHIETRDTHNLRQEGLRGTGVEFILEVSYVDGRKKQISLLGFRGEYRPWGVCCLWYRSTVVPREQEEWQEPPDRGLRVHGKGFPRFPPYKRRQRPCVSIIPRCAVHSAIQYRRGGFALKACVYLPRSCGVSHTNLIAVRNNEEFSFRFLCCFFVFSFVSVIALYSEFCVPVWRPFQRWRALSSSRAGMTWRCTIAFLKKGLQTSCCFHVFTARTTAWKARAVSPSCVFYFILVVRTSALSVIRGLFASSYPARGITPAPRACNFFWFTFK